MRYKPDWDEAKERLTAMWEGRELDRPCMSVCAPSGRAVTPPPPPRDLEQLWIDPDYIALRARHDIESRWWGGEAAPSWLLMCGWVICFGGTPRFASDTIWFDPVEYDLAHPPRLTFDPQAPWCQRYERCLRALVALAQKDDFLVGCSCVLPANDVLSMQMGTEPFLMNLMDHPEWMREAIVQGARAQQQALAYYAAIVKERHDFWYGNGGWMPFWAPQYYASTQSDVSCMLSPAMYDEFIVPELEVYGKECGALWYHLDGGDARQHLPRLLSLPYLRVLQYTPAPCEPPNGPAHLDFYQRVQAAGKIVHIQLPKQNVEPLVRALDPRLLMLDTWCNSIAEGQELLQAATHWTRNARRC